MNETNEKKLQDEEVKTSTDQSNVNQSTPETIGSYLKKVRESKKVTLEEVSQRTKILLTVLKELESDNFKALPGKTYLKGFVKSYAKEIGADVSKTLSLLEQQYSTKVKPKKIIEDDTRDIIEKFEDDIHNLPNNLKSYFNVSLKTPLIILFVTLAIGYPIYHIIKVIYASKQDMEIKQQKNQEALALNQTPQATATDISNNPNNPKVGGPFFDATKEGEAPPMKNEAQIEIAPPVAETKELKETVKEEPIKEENQESLAPIPTPLPIPLPIPAKEEVKEEKKEDKKEEKKEAPIENKDGLSTKPFTFPLYSVKENAKENNNPEIIPDTIKQKLITEKENIYIKAISGDSWITYKRDNEPVRTFTIPKGNSILIQGNEVRIFMGNINATKVFYNNKLLEPLAPSGVKSMVFPEKNADKYMMPLFIRLNTGKTITTEEYFKIEVGKRPSIAKPIGLPSTKTSTSSPTPVTSPSPSKTTP